MKDMAATSGPIQRSIAEAPAQDHLGSHPKILQASIELQKKAHLRLPTDATGHLAVLPRV